MSVDLDRDIQNFLSSDEPSPSIVYQEALDALLRGDLDDPPPYTVHDALRRLQVTLLAEGR
jgi:hypothetical protein